MIELMIRLGLTLRSLPDDLIHSFGVIRMGHKSEVDMRAEVRRSVIEFREVGVTIVVSTFSNYLKYPRSAVEALLFHELQLFEIIVRIDADPTLPQRVVCCESLKFEGHLHDDKWARGMRIGTSDVGCNRLLNRTCLAENVNEHVMINVAVERGEH